MYREKEIPGFEGLKTDFMGREKNEINKLRSYCIRDMWKMHDG